MPNLRFCLLTLSLAGLGFWLSRVPEPSVSKTSQRPKLPVYFIENQGQVDDRVSFYVQGRHTAAYFTSTSVYYSLREPTPMREASTAPTRQAVVQLEFLDANPEPLIQAVDRTGAIVSYFRGPKEEWKTGLATYSGVVYKDLWPGIDLEFTGPEGKLKYTFHVRPGADPKQIRLAYRGARSITATHSLPARRVGASTIALGLPSRSGWICAMLRVAPSDEARPGKSLRQSVGVPRSEPNSRAGSG